MKLPSMLHSHSILDVHVHVYIYIYSYLCSALSCLSAFTEQFMNHYLQNCCRHANPNVVPSWAKILRMVVLANNHTELINDSSYCILLYGVTVQAYKSRMKCIECKRLVEEENQDNWLSEASKL